MSRLPLLLLIVTELMRVRTAVVTDGPGHKTRLDQLYEKLERFTAPPATESLLEKYAAKLEQLNAVAPDRDEFPDAEDLLTDDEEELLTAMQLWAGMSAEQIGGMAKELQLMRLEAEESKYEEAKDEDEAFEDGWNDDEPSYAWDADEDMSDATTSRSAPDATPSSIVRSERIFEAPAPVDPIAATNRRPRVLEDSSLSGLEYSALYRAAIANMGTVMRASRCLTPQPRWLSVRQLAPASDILYMPPCVQLHRCAPDSGCCPSEDEVCAPVEGAHVTMPFYLHRADGNDRASRMVFYNHTKCACIPREELLQRAAERVAERAEERAAERAEERITDESKEQQSERQPPTEEPKDPEEIDERKDESAPMMKRCTCPTLFLARTSGRGCACVCDWPEPSRRRDCLSQSRGREHFGMRDRVCISIGDCTYPTCEYGGYVRGTGRCPIRRLRKIRYHRNRYGGVH